MINGIRGEDLDQDGFIYVMGMSSNVEIHNRQIYSILDLLGDIGGLFDALKAIASIFLSIIFTLTGNPIEEFLISLVYKRDDE